MGSGSDRLRSAPSGRVLGAKTTKTLRPFALFHWKPPIDFVCAFPSTCGVFCTLKLGIQATDLVRPGCVRVRSGCVLIAFPSTCAVFCTPKLGIQATDLARSRAFAGAFYARPGRFP